MKMVAAICALGREDVYRWVLGLQVHAGRVIGGVTNMLFGVAPKQALSEYGIIRGNEKDDIDKYGENDDLQGYRLVC